MTQEQIAVYAPFKDHQLEVSPSLSVVRIVQQQDVPLDIVVTAGSPQMIRGAVDAIEWHILSSTVELVRDVLVSTGTYESKDLQHRFFLLRRSNRWSAAAEIVASPETLRKDLKQTTASLVQFAFSCLVGAAKEGQGRIDMPSDASSFETVKSCVDAALAVSGGRSVRSEIQVDVEGEPVAILRGRLKSKPDRSDFTPVPVEINGRLTGVDVEREVLFFRCEEGDSLLINFGKLDLDIVELAGLMKNKIAVCVRLHRTRDRKGEGQYAFVRLVPPQVA